MLIEQLCFMQLWSIQIRLLIKVKSDKDKLKYNNNKIKNAKMFFIQYWAVFIIPYILEDCQYKMERLPQKFEIWKYNADEDKKVLDFCTEEVKEEIDKVSDSIKEYGVYRF